MSHDKKIVVVMPAYNAAKTLRITYADLPPTLVDQVILVDDGSSDDTVKIARELGLELFVHNRNYGYGANQKTCYREALKAGAEIIVMVHPDYQYDPKLLPRVIEPIERDEADVVLGSRLMEGNPHAPGHAVVEVCFQSFPDVSRESGIRTAAERISHRLSSLSARGAGGGESRNRFR